MLKKMEEVIGEKPKPQVLFSKICPEWLERQINERKLQVEKCSVHLDFS